MPGRDDDSPNTVCEKFRRLYQLTDGKPFVLQDIAHLACSELGYSRASELNRAIRTQVARRNYLTNGHRNDDEQEVFTWMSSAHLAALFSANQDGYFLAMLGLRYSSIDELVSELNETERAALDLLEGCPLNLTRSERIQRCNEVMDVLEPDELDEFCDRMLAGGVFNKVGPNHNARRGMIIEIMPRRVHEIFDSIRRSAAQTVADEIALTEAEIRRADEQLATCASDIKLAQNEFDDLTAEDAGLAQEEQRFKDLLRAVKRRRSENKDHRGSWGAVLADQNRRKLDARLARDAAREKLAELEAQSLSDEELAAYAARIDDLSPAHRAKLIAAFM